MIADIHTYRAGVLTFTVRPGYSHSAAWRAAIEAAGA